MPELSAGADPVAPSNLRIFVLWILAIGTWVGVDWYAAGPDVGFALFGLPGIVWYGVCVLLVAWALWQAVTPRQHFRTALALALAAAPLLILINYLLAGFRESDAMLSADKPTLLLWLSAGLILLIASRLTYARTQWLGVGFALAGAAGFFWIDDQVYVSPSVWYPTGAQADDYAGNWERAEQVLFSQSHRIDQIVDQMERGEGKPAAFFVGFAGYAEEKVFAEEIRFAAGVLGDRYDSRGRTLLLINDARASEPDPIASVSGLQYGLNRIAARMDLENDLLVLAISSHGSDAPLLSVSNGAFPLRDLDAGTLREALDGARIKWRVIIVSACFAGAFIHSLATPYSAIITSAAPDRTSFGCSNERDLTYFGEAFYRDALPGAASLRAAFEIAESEVALLERKAGYEPSNPKAYFGEAIERQLSEYGPPIARMQSTSAAVDI